MLDDILDIFFDMLRECVESITLPTGENLLPTFIYSVVISVAAVLCNLTNTLSLINWKGALIATGLFAILLLLERKGNNEISRLYRAADTGSAGAEGRAERSGSPLETCRGTNPGDETAEPRDGSSDSDYAVH